MKIRMITCTTESTYTKYLILEHVKEFWVADVVPLNRKRSPKERSKYYYSPSDFTPQPTSVMLSSD